MFSMMNDLYDVWSKLDEESNDAKGHEEQGLAPIAPETDNLFNRGMLLKLKSKEHPR